MVTMPIRLPDPSTLSRLLTWTLTLLLAPLAFPTGATEELDSIIAVVNEDVIVRSEVQAQLRELLPQLAARGTELPAREVLERQILERLIDQRLQLQRAAQLGIQVDEAMLTRAVNSIAERNGLTLQELRDALEAEGMDFNQFREDTRQQIIFSQLRGQEVMNRIVVTDQEIDRFLEKEAERLVRRTDVHLYHILIATPEGADAESIQRAKAKAEDLVKRLRAGASFEQLALTYSDGRNALEGGDLGWYNTAEVPTLAVEPAQNLRRGEVSDPIRSSSGFHLIKVADYKSEDQRRVITQTRARHILIKTNEVVADQEAETRLSQLHIRLQGGEDFASLARSHSDDTASAIKGGDLGWVNPGDMVPDFEKQMNALAPGEASQPFRSPFGWHIVQVLERRDQDATDIMLRNKAADAIKERKATEAEALWLRQLRDEAYVEIRLEEPKL